MKRNGIPWEDTLLATHSFASHLPKSLAHVASVYLDCSAWKAKYKGEKGLLPVDLEKSDVESFLKYGAADAQITARVWAAMQDDLERERPVYEHDKKLASLCADMTVAGVEVDRERAQSLERHLKHRKAALKGRLRALAGRPDYNPRTHEETRDILFRVLRGQWRVPTSTGKPSTSDAALEHLQGTGTIAAEFAELLLRWRVVDKVWGTYVKSIELDPNDLRAHFNWKPFGTVSGRLSCRIQSCPRWADPTKKNPETGEFGAPEERIREIYCAGKGRTLVAFDVRQMEMKLAAYLSGDPDFIRVCGGDVHTGNAAKVFPQIAAKGWLDGDPNCADCVRHIDRARCTCPKKDIARGKRYRDIAKNLGFAIAYGAEAEKVFITLRRKGFPTTFNQVSVILSNLRNAYRQYYRWVDANLAKVRRDGYMRTALLGRIRWLGWYPKPTEVANFPIQSCGADIVNRRSLDMKPIADALDAPLVLQVHDALYYDCPNGNVQKLLTAIKAQWAEPIHLPSGDLVLTIDIHTGQRWSELG
jgi:DNA polymerase I-like protein with 3'-5' exonuclease and polymerase domains